VKLAGQDGHHVHAGEGFFLDEDLDVVAVDLEEGGLVEGHGAGVVGGAFEHGGEAEELAVGGLGDEDLLLVFVDDGDVDGAGDEDIGGVSGVSGLVDALAGGEGAELDLGGEDVQFLVVEEGEEGDVAEFVGGAGHARASGGFVVRNVVNCMVKRGRLLVSNVVRGACLVGIVAFGGEDWVVVVKRWFFGGAFCQVPSAFAESTRVRTWCKALQVTTKTKYGGSSLRSE
jgi:hypothetical protein